MKVLLLEGEVFKLGGHRNRPLFYLLNVRYFI